jgi:diguanylate cyclase (GGDEF)-like protein
VHLFIFSAFCCYGLFRLIVNFKTSVSLRRNQIRYILLGSLIGFPLGGTTYLLVFDIPVYPFGLYLTWLYTPVLSYAILKYRLMDIRIVFSRVLAISLLGIGAVVLNMAITVLLQPFLGYIAANSISLLVVGFLIFGTPLRSKTLFLTDSIILKRKYEYQQILRDAARAVTTMLDLDDLLNYIIESIRKSLNSNKIALLISTENGLFKVRCGYGIDKDIVSKYQVKNGVIDWMRNKKTVFIKEEQEMGLSDEQFARLYKDMGSIGAELAVPLFFKGELEGVLTIDHKLNREPYVQSDLDLLEILAYQAAIAIKNAQLYEEAIHDSLTGIFHHKYFQMRLKEEIQRSLRYSRPLSLLMIDIDYFKSINDKYGHQMGDEILKIISAHLKQFLRKADIVARYGGEEFAIILTETDMDSAAQAAERIRKSREKYNFITDSLLEVARVNKIAIQDMHIAVSIGLSFFDGKDDKITPEQFIRQSDLALYKAKDNGRNRVEIFRE